MRLLLLLSGAFTVSHVYSIVFPDVANLDHTLQGVTAGSPNSCGGPTSQRSLSTTDHEELQTHRKRVDGDLPDHHISSPDDFCPAATKPSKTNERKTDCPDGLFAFHLCCSGPTEESRGLYPNIIGCRFSTSKNFLIALCRNSVLIFYS